MIYIETQHVLMSKVAGKSKVGCLLELYTYTGGEVAGRLPCMCLVCALSEISLRLGLYAIAT